MATINPYQELDSFKGTRYKIGSAPTVSTGIVQAHVVKRPDDEYAKNLQGKRLILENQLIESRHSKMQTEKKARQDKLTQRQKAGAIGRNEAKRKGLWAPDKTAARYALFLPIHHLWLAYIAELLNLPPHPEGNTSQAPLTHLPAIATTHGKLVKADFHGALISVKKSKNEALEGHVGIIVHETENTFKIVTKDDNFKVIPKRNSIFAFRIPIYTPVIPSWDGSSNGSVGSPLDLVPSLEFELYGNQFCFRSADRATRKFKHKETLELL